MQLEHMRCPHLIDVNMSTCFESDSNETRHAVHWFGSCSAAILTTKGPSRTFSLLRSRGSKSRSFKTRSAHHLCYR
jgi:hypothetical protein